MNSAAKTTHNKDETFTALYKYDKTICAMYSRLFVRPDAQREAVKFGNLVWTIHPLNVFRCTIDG